MGGLGKQMPSVFLEEDDVDGFGPIKIELSECSDITRSLEETRQFYQSFVDGY